MKKFLIAVIVFSPLFLLRAQPSYWYRNLGGFYMNRGRYRQALSAFTQISPTVSLSAKTLYSIAFCYYKTGQIRQALEILKKVHMTDPAFKKTTGLRGSCLMKLGKYRSAIPLWKGIIARRGFSYFIASRLGLCYDRIGNRYQALIWFQKALLYKKEGWLCLKIATLFWRLQRYGRALFFYRQAVFLGVRKQWLSFRIYQTTFRFAVQLKRRGMFSRSLHIFCDLALSFPSHSYASRCHRQIAALLQLLIRKKALLFIK